MFLTAPDLIELTGKRLAAAQRRALERMGIPFHTRPDGKPVVAVAAVTGQGQGATQAPPANLEPKWSMLL